jgi:lipopolysaccharide transport system ATP-binding protein
MSKAIEVEGIGKRYRLGERMPYRRARAHLARQLKRLLPRGNKALQSVPKPEELWALRDISIDINQGEVVGLIGRNGAGKTTLLRILAGITEPTEGRCILRGSVSSLLEVGTGFHPELTGRENVYMNGVILGMSRAQISSRFDGIVEYAGVAEFIDTPVKRYSSGMAVRLAFAVAAHLDSEVMLVDEVLAVGDAEFQKRSTGTLDEIGSGGRTVVFVSHSMPTVLRVCPRVVLLDHGRVIADGPARHVIRRYLESGLGTTAARSWDPNEAPGDDTARLLGVRVLDASGQVSEEIEIRSEFHVEVEYLVNAHSHAAGPTGAMVTFKNMEGTRLFASTNQAWLEDQDPELRGKLVKATCHVPGNLLAEGQLAVNVLLASRRSSKVHWIEQDAVAFHIVDRSQGDGARGYFTNDWPGVVRPKLEWSTTIDEPQRVRKA